MIGSFLNSKGANSFTETNADAAYRNRPTLLSILHPHPHYNTLGLRQALHSKDLRNVNDSTLENLFQNSLNFIIIIY